MFSKVLFVALLFTVGFAYGEKAKFNGYKVYRATPTTIEQVHILRDLENLGISFWSGPNPPNRSSDLMVPPHLQGELIQNVEKQGIKVEEYIADVQTLIDNEGPVISQRKRSARLEHDAYYTYDVIYEWLDEQAALHPDKASVINIGKSFEGKDLKVLKVSTGGGDTKRVIWVDANIHAREWITNAVCLYLIDEVLNGDNPVYKQWIEDYDWYFLPMHNPDGYQFSLTNRMWRKTRSDTSSPLGCKGADANRNWDFHWFTGGSSSNPCADTYAGPNAFSEPETLQVSEFLKTIVGRMDFFLSLHSYSQLILIPYGVEVPFGQHEVYMDIGLRAKAAIAEKYNTQFTPGNIVDLLYVASGGSMDWVKGVYDVPLTYTFEMRDEGRYGFILPAELIVPSSLEFLDGLAVIIDAVRDGVPSSDAEMKKTKPAIIPQIGHAKPGFYKPSVDTFRDTLYRKH